MSEGGGYRPPPGGFTAGPGLSEAVLARSASTEKAVTNAGARPQTLPTSLGLRPAARRMSCRGLRSSPNLSSAHAMLNSERPIEGQRSGRRSRRIFSRPAVNSGGFLVIPLEAVAEAAGGPGDARSRRESGRRERAPPELRKRARFPGSAWLGPELQAELRGRWCWRRRVWLNFEPSEADSGKKWGELSSGVGLIFPAPAIDRQ